jgi:hypothetical protein
VLIPGAAHSERFGGQSTGIAGGNVDAVLDRGSGSGAPAAGGRL